MLAVAACGPDRSSGVPAVSVTEETKLLELIDRGRWDPEVINLNNPAIKVVQADLGDGPVPALFSHPASSVSWTLHLAGNMELRTAVGLRAGAWDRSGDGAGFRVVVNDGRSRRLFHQVVDPRGRSEDRGWIPVRIDLSPWSGSTLILTLATDIGPAYDPSYDWAVWRDPRLVPRPAD